MIPIITPTMNRIIFRSLLDLHCFIFDFNPVDLVVNIDDGNSTATTASSDNRTIGGGGIFSDSGMNSGTGSISIGGINFDVSEGGEAGTSRSILTR